ncbi:DUF3883 domain-containing protein [Nonomuraea sp. NPDC049419]|uniref:protein NO VEIN domain-containing protein n=1 Tax=Nonomuraea sp. NPDC049419 TaxID=3155772 RepID=UPI003431ACF6
MLEDVQTPGSIAERVFEATLKSLPWFQDADVLVQSPGELPDDALRASEVIGLSTSEAFRQVHALWGKVDLAQRARIGAAGETALVELLRKSTNAHVEQVSQHSDAYGYDIDVRTSDDFRLHLEVKASLRRHRLVIFLSRHEYETMLNDRAWQLVAVRLAADFKAEAVCSIPTSWIKENAPHDHGLSGRWDSCRLTIPSDQVQSGIPRLLPLLNGYDSPMLDGSTDW